MDRMNGQDDVTPTGWKRRSLLGGDALALEGHVSGQLELGQGDATSENIGFAVGMRNRLV